MASREVPVTLKVADLPEVKAAIAELMAERDNAVAERVELIKTLDWTEAAREALAARLERAEKVVGLVGINPVGVGERAAALCQAYIDYAKQYGDMHHLVSDEEVAELARRRQEIREATLARLRATPSTSEPTP